MSILRIPKRTCYDTGTHLGASMRNAVIRKKRLKVERAHLDFISKPMRIVIGAEVDSEALLTASLEMYRHLGIW